MSQKSRFWNWIDQWVKVDLKDQRAIIGTLIGFDKHLNFIIADAEEIWYQKKKGGVCTEISWQLGLTILWGENVVGIRMDKNPQQLQEQVDLTREIIAGEFIEEKQQETNNEEINLQIPSKIEGL